MTNRLARIASDEVLAARCAGSPPQERHGLGSTDETAREFEGQTYVLERAIWTEFALVHAWKGDRHGNLVYRHSAANFNPVCASAGAITIAEVEQLVEPGEIDAAQVHTPGVMVARVVHISDAPKRIEKRTVRP